MLSAYRLSDLAQQIKKMKIKNEEIETIAYNVNWPNSLVAKKEKKYSFRMHQEEGLQYLNATFILWVKGLG